LQGKNPRIRYPDGSHLRDLPGIIFSVSLILPGNSKICPMVSQWSLLFVLAFAYTGAQSQISRETHSRTHWDGFGVIQRGRNLPGMKNSCGIYSTSQDRQSGKLSLAIACKSETHKIKSGFIGDKSAIKIVRDDETHQFLKSDIYGYRDCHGNEYHFYDGKSYELLNPGESIAMYRIFEWKGKQQVAKHFFRSESMDAIKPLTLRNLSNEFSEEPLFLEKLHLLAKNDFQLVRYLYAVNRVREEVQNSKFKV
jgi:hypothetical protein